MNFKYLAKVTQEGDIEIENIGNCAINANNDLAFEWLLIIKTIMGVTEVIEYGPFLSDLKDYSPANVSCSYNRFDFNEAKIKKRISSFLNDGYRNITQAFEIPFEEAEPKIKNLLELLRKDDD